MCNTDWLIEGDALELLQQFDLPVDLVVTDPPYAFGGSGTEHALSATVAIVLRETAKKLRRGSWMVILCASSWRSISHMVEAVRGEVTPVRVGTWCKPESKTKVKTPGWAWASVSAITMRKGPKNRPELKAVPELDHLSAPIVTDGRRAQLPVSVAEWAVSPFVISGGVFLDPFAGSGELPRAALRRGMDAYGFEIDP